MDLKRALSLVKLFFLQLVHHDLERKEELLVFNDWINAVLSEDISEHEPAHVEEHLTDGLRQELAPFHHSFALLWVVVELLPVCVIEKFPN